MINFKLGQEMKNDVINMSRVWNKEKIEKNPRQELNLLRRFIFRMAEASAKRVTGDKPQGTMGRV